jgi:hypothetical protein
MKDVLGVQRDACTDAGCGCQSFCSLCAQHSIFCCARQ